MLGIFLDTETNGLNSQKHKIIELAFKILDVKTGTQVAEYQSIVFQTKEEWETADKSSLLVNGFSWDEISSKGRLKKDISTDVLTCFEKLNIKRGNAVFICQNPSFDRAFFSQLIDADIQEKLGWPYHWLDLASMYWAESIRKGEENPLCFPWKTGVSKDKIALANNLPPENKPHRAMNGVDHLLLCYKSVVGFPQEALSSSQACTHP